jgi:membrane protease YdiL (CAAX protease family)
MLGVGLVLVAVGVFSLAFVVIDRAYIRFVSPGYPSVGGSVALATLWGVLQRGHLLLLAGPLVIWRHRLFGFQLGTIGQHWRMLLAMLLVNCGVVAAYLWLTHSTTPYSGNEWLITEAVTVPLVEETIWRGLALTTIMLALGHFLPAATSGQLAIWVSGIAFGLLHAANLLHGMPAAFVALQTLNAVIWGIMYGYARVKTNSIYPPMALHAAMNLIVVLF